MERKTDDKEKFSTLEKKSVWNNLYSFKAKKKIKLLKLLLKTEELNCLNLLVTDYFGSTVDCPNYFWLRPY